MKNFSFRAECSADVERLQQACAKWGLLTAWTMHADKTGLPDIEVDLQSTATLDELRQAARDVKDGHVMLQTMRECRLADNTLERDYDLR
ncbi:hypothetical protein LA345_37290 (plasmid) [Burkholderia vietnamiensis]|nr:hypothetical protein [Burkholderia vietnamiensis]